MVQTSNIAAMAQNTGEVMLKERVQIDNVQSESSTEGCYGMKVGEIQRCKVLT